MPYQDDFESYAPGKMAKYFADQAGIFEVAERPDGGKCLRQTVARRGIDWMVPIPIPTPIRSSAGRSGATTRWLAMRTSRRQATWRCSAALPRPCSMPPSRSPPHGYWLKVSTDGRWELKAFTKTLAAGTVPFAADRWHKLALKFAGSNIAVLIDGVEVKTMKDGTFSAGMAGVGSGWNTPCTTTSPCGRSGRVMRTHGRKGTTLATAQGPTNGRGEGAQRGQPFPSRFRSSPSSCLGHRPMNRHRYFFS